MKKQTKTKGQKKRRRSAASYLREVKKRITANPTEPVRLDLPRADAEAVCVAFKKGGHGLHGRLLWQPTHINPMLQDAAIQRVTFFGAQYEQHEPMKAIPAKDAKAAHRIAKRLQKSESDDLMIYPAWRERHVVEIWRAWDYVAHQTRAWSGREVAAYMGDFSDGILSLGTSLLAEKGAAVQQRGRDHMDRMNASKIKMAKELRAFIRKEYRKLEPQIRSKALLVKEARESIRDQVAAAGFEEPGRHEPYRPSDSTIDRALGKKDTKRKKK